MPFSAEQKLRAAIAGPLEPMITRDDTRVFARKGWFQLVTPSAPGTLLNEIAFSQVAVEDAERAIDEAIATYHPTGHPVKWCVGPWTEPADFGERLLRRGFTSSDVLGMGCDVDLAIDVNERVATFEVDPHSLEAFIEISLRGWATPSDQAAHDRLSYRRAMDEGVRFFGARVNGEWLGTAGLVPRDGFGYLLGAQVLEGGRGMGLYKALVAARVAALRAEGRVYAVTHARAATSAPILARLGFETLFASKCWVLPPP